MDRQVVNNVLIVFLSISMGIVLYIGVQTLRRRFIPRRDTLVLFVMFVVVSSSLLSVIGIPKVRESYKKKRKYVTKYDEYGNKI